MRAQGLKKVDLSLPTKEEIEECYNRTKPAIQSIIDMKLAGKSNTAQVSNLLGSAETFVKYTPTQGSTKMIKIVEAAVDPMLPPKFKNNQKTPSLPDQLTLESAILKPKAKPMTAEEQRQWYIPPVISNWKNPKGFTIDIEKRVAAFDNREKRKHELLLSDNFGKLADSLKKADEKARAEIKARNRLRLKVAEQKKLENEEKLRQLAIKARENRERGRKDSGQVQRENDRRMRLKKYEKELKQLKGLIPLEGPKESSADTTAKSSNNSNVDAILDPRMFTKVSNSSEHLLYDTPLFKQHEAIQNIYTFKNTTSETSEDVGRRFQVLSGGANKEDIAEREGEAVRFIKGDEDEPPRKKSRWNEKE